MADQPNKDLTVPTADAGAAFRLEMWASNAILGYWWVLALAVGAILAGVAVYGIWDSTYTGGQETTHAEAFAVLERLESKVVDRDKLDQYSQSQGYQVTVSPAFEGMEPAFPPRVTLPLQKVVTHFAREGVEVEPAMVEAGDEMMAVAGRGSGVAADHAALLAADLYRQGGSEDGRTKALAQVRASTVAPVRYAGDAAAALDAAEAGEIDNAAAILRPWIAEENGFLGQQAAVELGGLFESADRDGDAVAVYQELKATWPASPLLDTVDDRLEALGEATAAPSVPAEGEPAQDAPAEDAPATPGEEG